MLQGINAAIAKESYLDVGEFKIPLRHRLPYNRLLRPRACLKGQVPNGRSVTDEGHLGAHDTDGSALAS